MEGGDEGTRLVQLIHIFGEVGLMKWMRRGLRAFTACVFLSLAVAANAASSYSNSLTSFSGDSSQAATQAALGAAGLTVFGTGAIEAATFDGTGAHFGAVTPGDSGRNYLRTSVNDFASMPFTAEITFELSTAVNDNGTPNDPTDDFIIGNNQAVFFGIGSGDTALFGTPDWSTLLSSASYWPETGTDKFIQFKTANDSNVFVDTNVPVFAPGTHRFRMTYDPTTTRLVGSIDVNYAGGPFVADATGFPMVLGAALTNSPTGLYGADGWPSEPSRIFFGGDDGAVFRDLTINVVPEPSAAILLLLGMASIAARRLVRCSGSN
jgi:hypothetical protein